MSVKYPRGDGQVTVEAAETGETLTHVFVVAVEASAAVLARIRKALIHFRFASLSFKSARQSNQILINILNIHK